MADLHERADEANQKLPQEMQDHHQAGDGTGSSPEDAPPPADPVPMTKSEARLAAGKFAASLNAEKLVAYLLECAGSGDPAVHAAWVKARTIQKVGQRGIADLLAGEKQALAASCFYYQLPISF